MSRAAATSSPSADYMPPAFTTWLADFSRDNPGVAKQAKRCREQSTVGVCIDPPEFCTWRAPFSISFPHQAHSNLVPGVDHDLKIRFGF